MNPLVTLTTDFGTRDPYAAAMKGVLLGICPAARIIDLTHDIAPQSIVEAALFLAGALPYWPAGSVHIAVVDPGVGGTRRPLALSAGGRLLVCPDNGIAGLYLRAYPPDAARVIENPDILRYPVSATFHGRDVFAPAAAHLAAGMPLDALGARAHDLVELALPVPAEIPGGISGTVIHSDRFGNLITNIRPSDIAPRKIADVYIAGRIVPVARTYTDAAPGELVALTGSAGYIEVAVTCGNAQAHLGLDIGAAVVARWR